MPNSIVVQPCPLPASLHYAGLELLCPAKALAMQANGSALTATAAAARARRRRGHSRRRGRPCLSARTTRPAPRHPLRAPTAAARAPRAAPHLRASGTPRRQETPRMHPPCHIVLEVLPAACHYILVIACMFCSLNDTLGVWCPLTWCAWIPARPSHSAGQASVQQRHPLLGDGLRTTQDVSSAIPIAWQTLNPQELTG